MENNTNPQPDASSLSITGPDGTVQVIDLSKIAPYNNPRCQHEFVDDPNDVYPHMKAQVCIKPGCNMGRMIKT